LDDKNVKIFELRNNTNGNYEDSAHFENESFLANVDDYNNLGRMASMPICITVGSEVG
jgi:hypothetical protein